MERKSTLMPQGSEKKYLTSIQDIRYLFANGGRKDEYREVFIPHGVKCKVSSTPIDGKVFVEYQHASLIIDSNKFKEVFGDETIYQGRLEKAKIPTLIEKLPLLSAHLIDNEGTIANLLTVKRTKSGESVCYFLTISQEYDVGEDGIKTVEHYTKAPRTLELQGYQFDRLYAAMNRKIPIVRPSKKFDKGVPESYN